MCGGFSHRFAEGLKDLPPQHMEVVSWGGAVHHNPVTVIQLLDLKVSCYFLKKDVSANTKHSLYYLCNIKVYCVRLTGKTSGSSLHICRKRSGRADECSGPWEHQLCVMNGNISNQEKGGDTKSWNIPFLPCHGEAVGQCHFGAPIWPGQHRWTGRWCTGLCCGSLRTVPPRAPVR